MFQPATRLDRVGDKWSMLITAILEHGALRYTDLQRDVPGISQRMLSLTLRRLQQDGLITRTAYAEVPPRVEYTLTPSTAACSTSSNSSSAGPPTTTRSAPTATASQPGS